MKTADKIMLEDLVVMGRVGHTPEEKANPQKIWLDVSLETDIRKAAKTGDIAHAVNYVDVANKIQEVLDLGPYNLAETVAEEVAKTLLQAFPPVHCLKIRVKKKTVPNAAFAVIEINRSR